MGDVIGKGAFETRKSIIAMEEDIKALSTIIGEHSIDLLAITELDSFLITDGIINIEIYES